MFRPKDPPKEERLLPFWVEAWLFLSGLICLLDVGFTMFRPHTTEDGSLATFYYGWNIYADVDVRYADTKDIVTCATGRVMLFEIFLNFLAIYLARTRSRHAVLTAFTTSAFVFWKTVWYLVLYIAPPAGNPSFFTEHSSYLRMFLVFWIPNGCWVFFPFLVLVALWNRLAQPIPSQYSPCNLRFNEFCGTLSAEGIAPVPVFFSIFRGHLHSDRKRREKREIRAG